MTELREVPGLTAVGPVVVLTGQAARACADAVLIAIRSRRVNGAPPSRHYAAIAAALMSASGHTDVRNGKVAEAVDMTANAPTVPVEAAARRLGLSKRQTRRLAPNLGGRRVGRQWLLDDQAITEHLEGGNRG